MNWIGKICWVLGGIFYISLSLANASDSNTLIQSASIVSPDRHYRIRVLLQEIEIEEFKEWKIKAPGFIIFNPEKKTKKTIYENELTITYYKNTFMVNAAKFDNQPLYIKPLYDHLKFEGKEYQGTFIIIIKDKKIYLINSIDIENYVCSVLRTESWPGWPLEVNKAFAIASRSYVMGIITQNRLMALPYHVKNTNKHQTYAGIHTDSVIQEAVAQTKGIFLAYENKPIVAMFDSCCGGIIPAHIHGINFNNAPYLAREYACTFCKGCRMYNWNVRFPLEQFEQLCKKEYKPLKKLKEVTIKFDKAGLVQQVHIKGHNNVFSFSGKKIYSMVEKVKSFCFNIVVSANEVIFNGKGIGHHLGLCQWGARIMVDQGYDYKSILSFYYPRTTLMRLQ